MKSLITLSILFFSLEVRSEIDCPGFNLAEWPHEITREAIDSGCAKEELPTVWSQRDRDLTESVDLNGDGRCEYLKYSEGGSGSGGNLFEIYSLDNDEYIKIGEIFSRSFSYRQAQNGWLTIEVSNYSGNWAGKELLTYNGESYVISKKASVECEVI